MTTIMNQEYIPAEVESKAQRYWQENNSFATSDDSSKDAYYALAMFPYPSGKLHLGHMRVYTITDLISRFQTMLGKEVLQPIGWDAFGLPAENAAINNNSHPQQWTYANIGHMRNQLKRLGFGYDWRREFATCDPDYYRWEQWFFIQLYNKGLIYRKDSWVNWDPIDKTVLANEQVEEGRGWRSGALVERRRIPQWFVRITAYADELLDELDNLEHWPTQVKMMQRNWLGKSRGAQIAFPLIKSNQDNQYNALEVFTTRPDTLMGTTFLEISPEHPLVEKLAVDNQAISEFLTKCQQAGIGGDRGREQIKIGIDSGLQVLHPISGEKLPVWVANFVLMEYGTGVVMSVPAHDQRDWEFATAYQLPIKQVIAPTDGTEIDLDKGAFTEHGLLINSAQFDGLDFEAAFTAIVTELGKKNQGEEQITWRLRDWGVSRQRYWGAPIPMIHCKFCGTVPVDEKDLPVTLPVDVTLDGSGSPLEKVESFVKVDCPRCSAPARRETDTLDTFFESSWYYARFACYDQNKAMIDSRAEHWCPVDQYVGGIEHAILHLLYARFFHKAMRDLITDDSGKKIITSNEPFSRLLAQGMVLAPTFSSSDGQQKRYFNIDEVDLVHDDKGAVVAAKLRTTGEMLVYQGMAKMSKSKNNGVDPQQVIDKWGADTARLYILFAAPPENTLEWSNSGVAGASRFLRRIWKLVYDCKDFNGKGKESTNLIKPEQMSDQGRDLWRKTNQTIAKVNDDITRRYTFNTAIAAIMELSNVINKLFVSSRSNDQTNNKKYIATDQSIIYESLCDLVLMLYPCVPHICHVLWQILGREGSVNQQRFPQADQRALQQKSITLIVQINGKLRDRIEVSTGLNKQQLENAALASPLLQKHLGAMTIRKVIVVPNKLVNLVAS